MTNNIDGEVTNEVLHMLLSSIAAQLKDVEERLDELEDTALEDGEKRMETLEGASYALDIRVTALEAIAKGEDV
jgi:hypothetical protein